MATREALANANVLPLIFMRLKDIRNRIDLNDRGIAIFWHADINVPSVSAGHLTGTECLQGHLLEVMEEDRMFIATEKFNVVFRVKIDIKTEKFLVWFIACKIPDTHSVLGPRPLRGSRLRSQRVIPASDVLLHHHHHHIIWDGHTVHQNGIGAWLITYLQVHGLVQGFLGSVPAAELAPLGSDRWSCTK